MKQRPFANTKLIFLFLVVLAFSIRLIYLGQTANFIQPGAGSDSNFYLQWAKDIVRGNLLGKDVFYALPVYPYFLSLAYLFSGGETFDLILIQLLLGSLNCGLLYLLGKRIFSERVGIIAGLLGCFYALFIFYDRMLLPASLAIFGGLILIFLLDKVRANPGPAGWLKAGFILGLLALTTAAFTPLAILILFWLVYELRKAPWTRRLLYCCCFILPFLAMLGGVTLRNYLVAGDKVLVSAHSGINFYLGTNPQANGLFKPPPYMRATQSGVMEDAKILAEQASGRRLRPSEVSHFWTERALDFIRQEPFAYFKLLGKKFVLFWNGQEHLDDIEYYMFNEQAGLFKLPLVKLSLVLPLALLGIFFSCLASESRGRRAWPKRKTLMPIYLFIFGASSAVILFFINSRYRLIIVPFLILFAAFALEQFFAQYQNKRYKNLSLALILLAAVYLLTNTRVIDASASLNFTLHYNKAVFWSDQGQYQKAREEFQTSLQLNPLDFMSYLGLGNIDYKLKDFPQAIANYQKSLTVNPYFYEAHFNLGLLYDQLGRADAAEQEFKQALNLKEDDGAAHYNLGRIYQKQGRKDLAVKEYQRALEIKPAHPEVLQALKEME